MKTKNIGAVLLVTFILVSCAPATTPTPALTIDDSGISSPTPLVMSDCFISFKIAAWQDLNRDGLWDISEPPLENVDFHLQGIFAEKWGPDPDPSKGDGWFSILIWMPSNCIEQEYVITAVPPVSYEATTPSVVAFSGSEPFEAQFGFHIISK